jgi:hypothetical protein
VADERDDANAPAPTGGEPRDERRAGESAGAAAGEPAGAAAGEPEPEAAPPPPELAPAVARFDRGDFRGARAELRALLAGAPTPEVQSAARDLASRMAPDPWALRAGLASAALLALLVWLYVL